jgi:hypothetical protein
MIKKWDSTGDLRLALSVQLKGNPYLGLFGRSFYVGCPDHAQYRISFKYLLITVALRRFNNNDISSPSNGDKKMGGPKMDHP